MGQQELPVQKSPLPTGVTPAKDYKDNKGTGVAIIQGEDGRARTV